MRKRGVRPLSRVRERADLASRGARHLSQGGPREASRYLPAPFRSSASIDVRCAKRTGSLISSPLE